MKWKFLFIKKPLSFLKDKHIYNYVDNQNWILSYLNTKTHIKFQQHCQTKLIILSHTFC